MYTDNHTMGRYSFELVFLCSVKNKMKYLGTVCPALLSNLSQKDED